MLMNQFGMQRQKLGASEGRYITDWDMSCLLGVSRRTITKLMAMDDEALRPCYLLAIQYAIRKGFEWVDSIIDTPTERFQDMLDDMPISYAQTAHFIGMSSMTLRRLRNRTGDVPRRYYLAVCELHERLAPPWLQALDEHASAYAESEYFST